MSRKNGKATREVSPEALAAHEAAMERIKLITGARTQVQLAEALEVRQSSISDAKRRASVPPEWLLKLMRTHQVLPDWILTGLGPKYLTDAAPTAVTRVEAKLKDISCVLDQTIVEIAESLRMARMTAAELAERKSSSMAELAEAHKTIEHLRSQVRDMAAEINASNFTM
ncbi:MAG: helix-turn-helix domain-containing protein [Desulfovibrio sp.]|nr:helix-turn-helix domain-containing protein [Desulfovibrio sp.]